LEFFVAKTKKRAKNPMIELIVAKFQTFRHRLFQLFPYRAGATMDLIDAVSAMTTADSVVKLSLSEALQMLHIALKIGSLVSINGLMSSKFQE
jgi:hypothetical protein